MRSSNQARLLAKKQAREQSMTGWNKHPQEEGKKWMVASRTGQRQISLGIGHHLPRMMKGHI